MDAESGRYANTATGPDRGAVARRVSTETKASYKTTEFAVYVVVFLGILLASLLVRSATRPRWPRTRRGARSARPGAA